MSQATAAPLRPRDPLSIDPRKHLFSINTFIAAALVLPISFSVSSPRQWWALLAAYVTRCQWPARFAPKTIYRLAGSAAGAVAIVVAAPNLQNPPRCW
ncbi:hypothetical protein [Burkholderia sp. MSMB1072]|uniref:hypothetical protein n=1 Tax=Burkholderia sp. MSMB1072 TaxID=1637871 RepID=UPI000A3EE944|nr:hypothetical protein [Burkholderia sp. MSMB1072]